MSKLLQINSSLFSEGGQSTLLANRFVEQWRQHHPEDELVLRDFAASPVPHLTESDFGAFITAEAERSDAQRRAVQYSDELIDELRAADIIVLGLPMYNFGIPSQLKAYFDHIARAGVTFRYTENGPEGLLGGKKVYVLAARGGMYQGTDKDSQSRYLTDFLNFIGITDIEFIYAEGLNMGDAPKASALDTAHQAIERLAA